MMEQTSAISQPSVQTDIEELKRQGMSERDAIYEAYRRMGKRTREAAQRGSTETAKRPAAGKPAKQTPAPAPKKQETEGYY